MTYAELIPYFKAYRRGELGRLELACQICMWQRQGARI